MITLFYVLAYWVVGVICTVAIIRLTNDVNVEDLSGIAYGINCVKGGDR